MGTDESIAPFQPLISNLSLLILAHSVRLRSRIGEGYGIVSTPPIVIGGGL